jgi:hypothetical protein
MLSTIAYCALLPAVPALGQVAATSVPFCTVYDDGMRLSVPMTRLPQNIQLRL